MSNKAGWTLSALLAAVLFLGAAAPAGDDQVITRLDELKAIATESLKLQKLDTHRRLWPNHKLGAGCDLGDHCDHIDFMVASHKRMYRHPFGNKCNIGPDCDAIEKTFLANVKAEEDAAQKSAREATLSKSWLVSATDEEFEKWCRRNGDTLTADELAFIKARRAEKAKSK